MLIFPTEILIDHRFALLISVAYTFFRESSTLKWSKTNTVNKTLAPVCISGLKYQYDNLIWLLPYVSVHETLFRGAHWPSWSRINVTRVWKCQRGFLLFFGSITMWHCTGKFMHYYCFGIKNIPRLWEDYGVQKSYDSLTDLMKWQTLLSIHSLVLNKKYQQ